MKIQIPIHMGFHPTPTFHVDPEGVELHIQPEIENSPRVQKGFWTRLEENLTKELPAQVETTRTESEWVWKFQGSNLDELDTYLQTYLWDHPEEMVEGAILSTLRFPSGEVRSLITFCAVVFCRTESGVSSLISGGNTEDEKFVQLLDETILLGLKAISTRKGASPLLQHLGNLIQPVSPSKSESEEGSKNTEPLPN